MLLSAVPISAAGFGCLLAMLLTSLSCADLRRFILPDRLNLALAVGGIAQSLAIGRPAPTDAAVGALLCGGILFAAGEVYRRLRGRAGLGRGDLKLGFAAGLWIGWQQVPLMLLIASLSALLFVLLGRRLRQPVSEMIPFGPFLSTGVLACWLAAAIG
ncbi:A24 family peptidase [Bradyrhizobium sp. WD16]|uniref:prepilin peptidase n=1 Tax=Bradyrhizobium sp. WD16 TaxID=1521768 RepID=UPI0020A600AB|nr:A24 family peptidase [Bradyrhizobium sp. WD16]UTD29051.1 prepilin peptidase [Bradyrhizobium sp. WD16]